MCAYMWKPVSWLSHGVYISWLESSTNEQIHLNCVLFLHRAVVNWHGAIRLAFTDNLYVCSAVVVGWLVGGGSQWGVTTHRCHGWCRPTRTAPLPLLHMQTGEFSFSKKIGKYQFFLWSYWYPLFLTSGDVYPGLVHSIGMLAKYRVGATYVNSWIRPCWHQCRVWVSRREILALPLI